MNLKNLKQARIILSKEIQDNVNLSDTDTYHYLLSSAGYLDTVILRLKKEDDKHNC